MLANITQVKLMNPGALVENARRLIEEPPIKAKVDPYGQLTIKVIKMAKETSPGFNLSEGLNIDVSL